MTGYPASLAYGIMASVAKAVAAIVGIPVARFWALPRLGPGFFCEVGLMETEWKDVPGYPGYRISDDGQVRGPRKQLGGMVNASGKRCVTLCGPASRRSVTVEGLVREVFGTEPDLPGEQWRAVPGYKSYEVSDLGRVRGRSGKLRAQTRDRKGYIRIVIYREGHHITVGVHQMVLAAFVGPCPEGKQCNHKNGIKDDNRLENLEYVTPSENMLHSYRELWRDATKNGSRGASHPAAISLDPDEVMAMRKGGMLLQEISNRVGASIKTIRIVLQGLHWTQRTDHVTRSRFAD